MEIHIAQNNEESGPYDIDEVNRLLAARAVHPNDLAWHVGLSGWQPLHTIAGVKIPGHAGPIPSPATPPPLPANRPVYVGFWRRFGAWIIDSILISLISLPLVVSIYGWDYFAPDAPIIAGTADFLISFVLPPVVIILFWIWKQATPGKMIVSAKVVDAVTLQKAPTSRLVLRYFAYILSTLPLCLGFLWIAFDDRKQGWHDKLAGTVVIRDPEGSLEEAFR